MKLIEYFFYGIARCCFLDSSRQGTGKWGALMKTVDGTHSQTPKGVLL